MDSLLLRCQRESDQKQQQHPATAPKPLDEQQQQQQKPPASPLALFVHEPDSSSGSKLATADTTTASPSTGGGILSTIPGPAPTTYPRPGSFFSLSQWRELELQALIYKYMVAGASVPLELILPIRRSLLNATPRHGHYHPYQHFRLNMMSAGYWGRCTSDPEPGRCRRTDGKKWRCARDVVAGHKYCERHMHRGRNRSRKHVEAPAPNTGGSDMTSPSLTPSSSLCPDEQRGSPPPLAGAPLDVLPLNRRLPPDDNSINGILPQSYCRTFTAEDLGEGRPGSRILRRFFDDWPSGQQREPDNTDGISRVDPPASTTKLSISIPEQPPKSDFSLKLSTGNSEKRSLYPGGTPGDAAGAQPVETSSWSGWAGQATTTSMGGPLAEALRLSSSTTSPTSVLQKPNAPVSETTSSVST